jgi:hypothetical protein
MIILGLLVSACPWLIRAIGHKNMTDLSQQTAELLKPLTTLHNDLVALNMTTMIASTVLAALLLIIAFRKR